MLTLRVSLVSLTLLHLPVGMLLIISVACVIGLRNLTLRMLVENLRVRHGGGGGNGEAHHL